MSITAEEVLAEIGPVQEILDEHDGVVTVLDTTDGNIMLSLDGGCTGCSSTPMTAMQIYYSLKKLDHINDVIFVNGELPEYMRTFIDNKMKKEAASTEPVDTDSSQPRGEII
ncbi:MAG: NifU family protein [Candidatus Poseidoniaceae archaeon]|nr:NifU family protein [Candidatus Poseidoniaceae archaeon]MDE0869939.1 NifU family protein [Candidatus Poseidoniaceae archaeon]|tara:strand:+ start:630 stop:965 length:336 start_codon:yes stop_codon:yes gene_type:complete